MPVIKLTKSAIDKIPYTTCGQRLYLDSELKCFGLKVGKEVKTFVVQKDISGRSRTFTIGRYGVFTTDEARREAIEILAMVARGLDPKVEKERKRGLELTVKESYESYLENRSLADSTYKDYQRVFNTHFCDWLKRRLIDLDENRVRSRFLSISKSNSKNSASKSFAYLRAVFEYVKKRYPRSGIENPTSILSLENHWYVPPQRQRYIDLESLPNWYAGLTAIPNVAFRAYLLFILLTGLRRREAACLTWDCVDFDSTVFQILKTKNGHEHCLPMSDFIEKLLRTQYKKAKGKFVFPGKDKDKHIEEPKRAIMNVTKSTGVAFTVHDLRRTFATICDEVKLTKNDISALLNHQSNRDVTANYIITDLPRMRERMQTVSDFVFEKIAKKLRANHHGIEHEGWPRKTDLVEMIYQ